MSCPSAQPIQPGRRTVTSTVDLLARGQLVQRRQASILDGDRQLCPPWGRALRGARSCRRAAWTSTRASAEASPASFTPESRTTTTTSAIRSGQNRQPRRRGRASRAPGGRWVALGGCDRHRQEGYDRRLRTHARQTGPPRVCGGPERRAADRLLRGGRRLASSALGAPPVEAGRRRPGARRRASVARRFRGWKEESAANTVVPSEEEDTLTWSSAASALERAALAVEHHAWRRSGSSA